MAGIILPHTCADIGDPSPLLPYATTPRGTLRTRGIVGEPRGPAQQVSVTLAIRTFGWMDEGFGPSGRSRVRGTCDSPTTARNLEGEARGDRACGSVSLLRSRFVAWLVAIM